MQSCVALLSCTAATKLIDSLLAHLDLLLSQHRVCRARCDYIGVQVAARSSTLPLDDTCTQGASQNPSYPLRSLRWAARAQASGSWVFRSQSSITRSATIMHSYAKRYFKVRSTVIRYSCMYYGVVL